MKPLLCMNSRIKAVRRFLFASALVLIWASAQSRSPGSEWTPYNELGDFYPSFAIAVMNRTGDAEADDARLGDPNGIMGITYTPTRANRRVSVQLTCSPGMPLFAPATLDVTVPEAGRPYILCPVIPFDQMKLASLKQPVTTYITYTVTIDGQRQPTRTEKLRVHSINDCPFAVTDDDGEITSISWMFAAYVNEEHPWIEQLLQTALLNKYIDSFSGYQGGETLVYQQVLAIWRVLQERHTRYSNVTTNATQRARVASQHVRLLDESIRYTQANCVDASVLLASILRKIGLHPMLVVVPGHMFVGFDLNEAGTKQAYLETTLLGVTPSTGHSADAELTQRLLTTTTDAGTQAAVHSFVAAITSGNESFVRSESALEDEDAGYALIDVADARELGIMPIIYVGKEPMLSR